MLHGLRRLSLSRGGHMGVGVQGEPGAVMAQHPRDGLYVHPVLQSQSCEGVPLRYNYDKPEKPRRIKGFEVFSLVFSSFSKPEEGRRIDLETV